MIFDSRSFAARRVMFVGFRWLVTAALAVPLASCAPSDQDPGVIRQQPQAMRMEGASGSLAMDVGDDHGCLVRTDGKLFCWGKNSSGQLGTGSTTQQPWMGSATAVDFGSSVPSRTSVVEVALGGDHSCARLSDGRVFCWGSNGSGESAQPTTTSSFTSPQAVSLGTGVLARNVSAGFLHACVVTSSGNVMCWGANGSGQLGDNSTGQSASPVLVRLSGSSTALSGIVAVTAGDFHTCALTASGEVYCWGAAEANGNTVQRTGASLVSIGTGEAVEVSAGGDYTCILRVGGTVSCWGANGEGQLGNGTTTSSVSPVAPTLASNATHISAGFRHTCALIDTSRVQCWGRNSTGQLGNGGTSGQTVPGTVATNTGGTPLTGMQNVAVGLSHSCGIRAASSK